VRFTATSEPSHVSYCHCNDCRQASGAPVSAFVGFAADAVTVEGDALTTYQNGAATSDFCKICGTPISYSDTGIPNRVYFMLGAMDAPQEYKPTLHAYVRQQLHYLHMPDGLPRYPGTSVPRTDGPTT
jgi:hypothetical protein